MADKDERAAWCQLLLAVQHHHTLMWRQLNANRANPYNITLQFEAARQDTLEILAHAATEARQFAFNEAILWGDFTQRDIAKAVGLSASRVSQILKAK